MSSTSTYAISATLHGSINLRLTEENPTYYETTYTFKSFTLNVRECFTLSGEDATATVNISKGTVTLNYSGYAEVTEKQGNNWRGQLILPTNGTGTVVIEAIEPLTIDDVEYEYGMGFSVNGNAVIQAT